MNPRDLPEVVAELIIEMHEVRSELNALNGRIDRLEHTVEEGLRLVREESRQNTDRLIEAFGRSMEPLINRMLDHEQRLTKFEKPQA
ncbi:MAG: hypothetical protein EOO56_23770 [Hymenobacter sp.]|nr:MAG: hypothetical protein EOO56_23770 [Hymenobacter sp.]